jgi:hypothetical protein
MRATGVLVTVHTAVIAPALALALAARFIPTGATTAPHHT